MTRDFIVDEERQRRQHDIKGALRTLRFACDGLNHGYRFDDNMAAAKIAAIVKAVSILESEFQLWETRVSPA